MENQKDLNQGCIDRGGRGSAKTEVCVQDLVEHLNKGRIEMDVIDTCEGRVDIVMSKSDFIDICNDSGWRINFCGDLFALCGDEVCFNYSEITCIASFYPKYITKPSRIREDRLKVFEVFSDKLSSVDIYSNETWFNDFCSEMCWERADNGVFICPKTLKVMADYHFGIEISTFYSR